MQDEMRAIMDGVGREMEFLRLWGIISQDDKDSILSLSRAYVQELCERYLNRRAVDYAGVVEAD